MSNTAQASIRRLQRLDEEQISALADLLIDCIDGGAGVSFLHPLAPAKARAFWRLVAADVETGSRALLVAEDDTGIVGTVQLGLDQPENQPHRADLVKLLVKRRTRGRGVGTALLAAAEEAARSCGKSLLVLDTNEGSDAERLYAGNGWVRVGAIPNYSLKPRGGELQPTVVFYKFIELQGLATPDAGGALDPAAADANEHEYIQPER
jgi:GNAT superfamily N-acetyltransferase